MLAEFTFNHRHLLILLMPMSKKRASRPDLVRTAPKWGGVRKLISLMITVPELNILIA
jgi:hypothetical protein